MIKIVHKNLKSLSVNYSDKIKVAVLNRTGSISRVIELLNADKNIVESMFNKNVKQLTSAVKIVLVIDKLLDSKSSTKKETNDLIFTLNKHNIKKDKRSKCRKNKRFDELIKNISLIEKFIQKNDLFGSLPNDLLLLNNTLENELNLISKKLYNYIFDYQNYYDSINDGIGKALDLKCCPYCNRNYITYIPDKNKRVIGPSYDHFFSKSKYKYITLSFYNLIPSCYVCNSNLKGSVDFKLNTHIHPYLGGFGKNVLFDFELTTKIVNGRKQISYQPILKKQKSITLKQEKRIFGNDLEKKSGSINIFKLQEIYQSHSDSVEEIYSRFDRTSPYYVGSIINLIKKLKTSESEFYRFYFRNYFESNDFNKRPLAKLDRDIYEKMKLISELTTKNK